MLGGLFKDIILRISIVLIYCHSGFSNICAKLQILGLHQRLNVITTDNSYSLLFIKNKIKRIKSLQIFITLYEFVT